MLRVTSLLSCLFTLLFVTSSTTAQWYKQESGLNVSLEDVVFTSANRGWCVGFDGYVLNTSDGMTWDRERIAPDVTLRAITFADTLTGWIVGDKGTVLRRAWEPGTVGIQWHPMPSGTTVELFTVEFTDALRGWVGGYGGTILATTDGGLTWSKQKEGESWEAVFSISFADSLTGWAVGSYLYHTTDGGLSWVKVTPPTTEEIRDVFFLDALTGWIVGRIGTIHKTTDGGITWVAQSSPTGAMLMSVRFVNPSDGWIVGGGVWGGNTWVDSSRVMETRDGGTTWLERPHATDAWLSEVYPVDRNHVWAVGGRGSIIRKEAVSSVATDNDRMGGEPEPIEYDLLGRVVSDGYSGVVLRFDQCSGKGVLSLKNR